jgi:hypothetical protein
VALRLARELDTASTPPHAVPRLANSLIAALEPIERAAPPPTEFNVRALLREVLP